MSLRRQVGFGLFWVAIATIGSKGLSLLRKLLLARLLVPTDFGLVAYASLAIGVLELFKELGFGSALIYRTDDMEEAANTTFLAVIGSSLALYVIAWFSSPLLATFFRNEMLVPVLRVLALTLVISSISQVPQTLMAKGMGFKKKVIPEMIAVLVGSVVSVALAFAGYGVWSIVYGQVIIAALMAVLVWAFCPWRPSFRFQKRVALELWAYGKHIIGSQVMVFFVTNIDDAFVGRLLGDAALGYYTLAYDLSNLPATHLARIVGQVLFPAFSKVQDEPGRLREVFFTSVRFVSLVAFPVAIVTLLYAERFIVFAYGNKWYPAAIPLQYLTIYGLARAIAVNMGSVFKAGGRPKWLFYIATWRLAMMAAFLYPAIKYGGVTGVAQLSAIVAVVDLAISLYLTNRIVRAPWSRYARVFVPMTLLAVVTAAIGYRLYVGIQDIIHPFISMPATGLLALALYAGAMYAYDPEIRRVTTWVISGVLRELRRALRREAPESVPVSPAAPWHI